jgi:ParB-like chromosome segregation protein Spo0J
MTKSIEIGFDQKTRVIALDQIAPTKLVSNEIKKTKKYRQIISSIEEIGLVEPLVVHRLNSSQQQRYTLLDGHLRLEALKHLKVGEARCLLAKDDEMFTYNKRINRLASVQEHYMILRALDYGVPEDRIARALGVNISRIREKKKLLDGICPEVVEILKDRQFSTHTANLLKKMKPVRQIEVAELMVATNNYAAPYVRALVVATPASQLKEPEKRKPYGGLSSDEQTSMEQEMSKLQRDIKAVEESYGTNMLTLVVANGYLSRLLENEQVSGYLRRHHGELHRQLETLHDGIEADIGLGGPK